MPIFEGKTVEAWQCGSGPLPAWLVDLAPCPPDEDKDYVVIQTVKGRKNVSVGDWAVKAADGTIHKMSDAKFRRFYAEVPESLVRMKKSAGLQEAIDNQQSNSNRPTVNKHKPGEYPD